MAAATKERDGRIVLEPSTGKGIHVADVETHPQYGAKLVLGGDTYELLSRSGENLAGELDFSEHHLAWDGDFFEAWTMDPGRESVSALRGVVEAAGHGFGGIGPRVAEAARSLVPDDELGEHDHWAEHGVRVRVTYESKQSGREMTKEGVVSSYDPTTGQVGFKRDDHKVNRVLGDAIYSQSSRYPYMGDVVKIEVWRE